MLKQYLLRRLTRLEPPYLICLLLFFALQVLVKGRSAHALAPHLAASLVYLHDLIYAAESPINNVAWSLEVEVQFYLIYALSLPWIRRIGVGRASLLALALDCAYRAWWSSLGVNHAGMHQAFTPFLFAPARFGEWMLVAWN